jgi:thiol:disulfide interchange protein DsbD
VDPGKEFPVVITAKIDPGWHLYSLTLPIYEGGGPTATTIKLSDGQPFSLIGDLAAPPPRRALDNNFNPPIESEFYEDKVEFGARVRATTGTETARYGMKFEATYIACSVTMCLPPRTDEIVMSVGVGKDAPPDPGTTGTSGAIGTSGTTGPAGTSGTTGTDGAGAAPALKAAPKRVPDLAESSRANTIGAYIGLAALMGALSLLTPCVFPMVPITISYFTNRAGKSRREATIQALVYGLGIVLTFTAVGFTLAVAFGASGLNRFAADPWLNLGITAMFIAFALSLFGVWEIALPAKLVTAASKADAGKGRFAGTLLMGLAFTLTSFTCTAPFLGSLLVLASQGDWQWPLAGMLAFSGIFALPFVILALVPQALSALPRSGPWLIAVKAVMGLVEIAAAMKFLSNVDLVWNWNVFSRSVVIGTWLIIAVVMAVYLAGWIKLGPVPRLRRPGIARWGLVAATVALAAWLGSGLAGRRLGELEAFLPPANMAHISGDELHWIENDWNGALAEAKKTNQLVMVDFTGYTCTNCRWMEANMFPKPEVARELSRYVRARLYTDRPGEPYQGFQRMERELFGTVALPYYAVFTPDGEPVVAFGGLTRDPAQFVNFLRVGLQQ